MRTQSTNKNQFKVENTTGLKEHYEHQYFDSGARITICELRHESQTPEEGPVAVGFSICSPRDNFNRKHGRFVAFNRAAKAYRVKHHISPINPREAVEYNEAIVDLYDNFEFKGLYLA